MKYTVNTISTSSREYLWHVPHTCTVYTAATSECFAVCGDIDRLTSLAGHFIESVFSCVELAVAFAHTLLVVASAAVLISAAERCLLRVLRHWHLLPTRTIYLIPPGVYDTFRSIAGGDDSSFSTSLPVSAVGLAHSECGDALPPTTVRAFRSAAESVGLRIPAVVATREHQNACSDGGSVLWRDSLPSSMACEGGHRPQFSETKVWMMTLVSRTRGVSRCLVVDNGIIVSASDNCSSAISNKTLRRLNSRASGAGCMVITRRNTI